MLRHFHSYVIRFQNHAQNQRISCAPRQIRRRRRSFRPVDTMTWTYAAWLLLPENTTFADFADRTATGERYVAARDLLYLPVYALALLALRCCFERLVSTRLAAALLIVPSARTAPEPNGSLERAYCGGCVRPGGDEIARLSKRLDLSEKRLRTWFRRRRNRDRPDLLAKFKETSWRLFFYALAFAYALATLTGTPWFWDTRACWTGYPFQPLQDATRRYYMLEGGFYLSLLVSLGRDNRRKDFAEQVVHHVATVSLIVFSYVSNFVRVGTLVMLVHDVSDVLLEAAKCAHYARRRRTADRLFAGFAVVFIASRLVVYPRVVLYGTLVLSREVVRRPFAGFCALNALLLVLQCLHVFWAYTILRMAWKMRAAGGQLEQDDRSDVEEVSSGEEEEEVES